jgi:hypothetical protein
MSYIVRSDHIAITSGNASTTGSKDSSRVATTPPSATLSRCVILATRTVASAADSEKSSAPPIEHLDSIAATSRPLPLPGRRSPPSRRAYRGGDYAMSRRWLTGCDCRISPLPPPAADRATRTAGQHPPLCGRCDHRTSGSHELRCFCATGPTLVLIPELRPDICFENFDRRVARCPDAP